MDQQITRLHEFTININSVVVFPVEYLLKLRVISFGWNLSFQIIFQLNILGLLLGINQLIYNFRPIFCALDSIDLDPYLRKVIILFKKKIKVSPCRYGIHVIAKS